MRTYCCLGDDSLLETLGYVLKRIGCCVDRPESASLVVICLPADDISELLAKIPQESLLVIVRRVGAELPTEIDGRDHCICTANWNGNPGKEARWVSCMSLGNRQDEYRTLIRSLPVGVIKFSI